jgi:hypothetical protein
VDARKEDAEMSLLRLLVFAVAILSAGAARAERVFDLEIEVRVNAAGARGEDNLVGLLTLYDDHIYTLVWGGEEFGGVWIQEKNSLQLFEESDLPTAEFFALLEDQAGDFAGFPVELTSLKYKESAKFDRSGNLRIRSQQLTTYRPGLRGTSPLKITLSWAIVGTLR